MSTAPLSSRRGALQLVHDVFVKAAVHHGRPVVHVELEVNGEKDKFNTAWGVHKGRVRAGVRLTNDPVKAAARAVALAVLTGDEFLRDARTGKTVNLTADSLLRMARVEGIGQKLVDWYIQLREERER